MNQPHDINPPKWPLKILRFFVKKEYLEEIEGDMEEIFRDNVERLSYRKARRIYTWEMLRLFRPILIKNLEGLQNLNQGAMFRNYFKISLRGLMKNPLNSFINIFGLALAIGLCVFAYAFARWTYSTDQFHEHRNEVYLTTFFANRDGSDQQFGTTPRPLGEMLREDFAHIKKVCRIEDKNMVMKHEDRVFHERVRYVDPEFLEIFTFPLKWGTPQSLADINSIILSEEMSVKYFGDQNPVGQSILMVLGHDRSKAFKITGVAKEFPKARTISFSFLVNFENLRTYDPGYNVHDWNAFVNATFIKVDQPSDLQAIERGMEKYKKLQNNAVKEDWAISSFVFEPLATLHERSEYIRDDISRSSRTNYVSIIYMVVMAVFMMALACFNYINIAIVSAARRLKEIGMRKSIGATRRIVIVQFLTENMVITFFALILGVIFGMTFFIPGFEMLWDFSMDFSLWDAKLWIYLPAVLILTSIASGIYPSLYISRFQVVDILKGSVKFGKKNPLTKVFLCFQLVAACIFIASAVSFAQNTQYLANRGWGYDPHESMYAVVPDRSAYEKLSALMAGDPDVLAISGSSHHLGKSHASTVLHLPGREIEVDQLAVDPRYFETMGLELMEGRAFRDYEGSDRQAVVVNELLVKNMHESRPGWDDPIGQEFRIDTLQYEVIGVVKDFHSYSFARPIQPTIFTVAAKNDYRFLSLKVRNGSESKTFKVLQAKWAELFPETPFDGGHQEDVWGFYFEQIGIYRLVWGVFAFIAVSLASLGLYGLVTLNVAGRVKEFSIRKVLGAGMKNIAVNILSQYTVLFAVALIIGAPLGYILTKLMIESSYVYHMPITFSGVGVAVILLVLILLATVFTQVKKVSKDNPVEGLKTE